MQGQKTAANALQMYLELFFLLQAPPPQQHAVLACLFEMQAVSHRARCFLALDRSGREPRRRPVTPTPRSRVSASGSRRRASFMTSATSMPSRLEGKEFR